MKVTEPPPFVQGSVSIINHFCYSSGVIVIGNTGFNLPRDLAARLGIVLTEQALIVDGKSYGMDDITLHELDSIFKTSKTYPYPAHPSAAQFVSTLTPILSRDPDLLVVAASRRLTGAYDAAISAARTLVQHPSFRHANIRVVDSGSIEIGAGLLAVRCAAAIKAGAANADVMDMCKPMVTNSYCAVIPDTLDATRNSGRMAFLKSLAADFLNVLPVLHISEGEVKSAKTVSRNSDKASSLMDVLVGRFGAGKKVWVAITHGAVPTQAHDLEQKVRAVFNVKYLINRAASPALYAMLGRGHLFVTMVPVDDRYSDPP